MKLRCLLSCESLKTNQITCTEKKIYICIGYLSDDENGNRLMLSNISNKFHQTWNVHCILRCLQPLWHSPKQHAFNFIWDERKKKDRKSLNLLFGFMFCHVSDIFRLDIAWNVCSQCDWMIWRLKSFHRFTRTSRT